TNVAAFGAFVDIGVHQDGLVHVSELADRRVNNPSEVVKPGDIVRVTVLGVDLPRRRISLSMRKHPENRQGATAPAGKDSRKKPAARKEKPAAARGTIGDALLAALNRK